MKATPLLVAISINNKEELDKAKALKILKEDADIKWVEKYTSLTIEQITKLKQLN